MSTEPERLTTHEPPGVPGFPSWGRVYLVVGICFVLTVVALAIFSAVYS